jgi:serine/threonine protein kinase
MLLHSVGWLPILALLWWWCWWWDATNQMKGTKQFMSFERLDHELQPDQYSFASDVWSLGISLYCLAAGKKTPFEKLGNNHLSLREHLLKHSVVQELIDGKQHSEQVCLPALACLACPALRPLVRRAGGRRVVLLLLLLVGSWSATPPACVLSLNPGCTTLFNSPSQPPLPSQGQRPPPPPSYCTTTAQLHHCATTTISSATLSRSASARIRSSGRQ